MLLAVDLGQYWQEIVVIGTPVLGIMIAGGIKWIKNKLASTIIGSTTTKIKDELGVEEYNALMNIIKSYGVRKLVKVTSELVNEFKTVSSIVPLIIAMNQNYLDMGVYDDSPVLKEIVENTLNNVE